MPFFTSPRAFQNANYLANSYSNLHPPVVSGILSQPLLNQVRLSSSSATRLPPHSSHPTLPHLAMLVFEAVLEVVCVSLPGYIIARQGMFSAEMQKFAANLNVTVFTPCLSMLLFPATKSTSNRRCSLHKVSLPIDNRQARGPRNHTPHLCRSDPRFIRLFTCSSEGIRVLEEASQFCHRHGSKSSSFPSRHC